MRPVDADAILKKIDKERKYLIARGQIGAEHILVKYCRDFVEDAPTIIPEGPKGEWIYNDYGNGCGNWHCSICKHIPYYATKYIRFLKFCPKCGADMKGGAE